MLTRTKIVVAALTLAGAALPIAAGTAHAGILLPCSGSNWPMFGHDLGHSFASPDTCINPLTAATFLPKWVFNTSSPVSGQPAVVGNTLFAGAFDGDFYALNTANGAVRWEFELGNRDREKTDYGAFAGSPAVTTLGGREMVVVGGGDTVLVLGANSGKLLGSLCLDRADPTCQGRTGITSEIESSPSIVPWTSGSPWPSTDELVVVGQDSNEHDPAPVEGMVALELAPSGALTPLWQFDPETGIAYSGLAPVEAKPTGIGCGDVWSSPTIDLSSRSVIFGAGNCDHPKNSTQNESTWAISLDTGALKWQASPIPYTAQHDLDFGASPNLLGNGLVGEGGKDGVYYAYPIASTAAPAPGPPAKWKVTVSTASNIGGMIGSSAVGEITTSSGAVHKAVFADTSIPVVESDPLPSLENDLEHPGQAVGVHAIDAVTHQVVWNALAGPSDAAAVYDNGVVFSPGLVEFGMLVLDANTGLQIGYLPVYAPPSSPAAVSGDSVYFGAGTTESGQLPYSLLTGIGGIFAYQTAL